MSINNDAITQKKDTKQVKNLIRANKNNVTNCGADLSHKQNVNKIPGTFLGFFFSLKGRSDLVSIRKTEAFVPHV